MPCGPEGGVALVQRVPGRGGRVHGGGPGWCWVLVRPGLGVPVGEVAHLVSRFVEQAATATSSTSWRPEPGPAETAAGSGQGDAVVDCGSATATSCALGTYVVDLEEVDQSQVAVVGGKGAHLGELSRMDGVHVPPGYCVTTDAFRRFMADVPSLDVQLDELARVTPDDRAAIATLSAEIRRAVEDTAVSDDLAAGSPDRSPVGTRAARTPSEEFTAYRALTPPRVLTSDGETLSGAYRDRDAPSGALVGLPVSAGTVEGRARVALDMTAAGRAARAVGALGDPRAVRRQATAGGPGHRRDPRRPDRRRRRAGPRGARPPCVALSRPGALTGHDRWRTAPGGYQAGEPGQYLRPHQHGRHAPGPRRHRLGCAA